MVGLFASLVAFMDMLPLAWCCLLISGFTEPRQQQSCWSLPAQLPALLSVLPDANGVLINLSSGSLCRGCSFCGVCWCWGGSCTSGGSRGSEPLRFYITCTKPCGYFSKQGFLGWKEFLGFFFHPKKLTFPWIRKILLQKFWFSALKFFISIHITAEPLFCTNVCFTVPVSQGHQICLALNSCSRFILT